MTDLPRGYILDQPLAAAGSALPEGYTLDAPADPRAAAVAAAPDYGPFTASTNAMGNALSFNLMDEAVAHAAAAIDPLADLFRSKPVGGTYDERVIRHLENQRVLDAAAEKQHPTASNVGRVGAIAAVAPRAVAGLVTPILRAATTGERIVNAAVGAGKGSVGGAGYSFASGYGAGEEGIGPRVQSGLQAAPSGALIGAALGGTLGGFSRVPVAPLGPGASEVAAAGQRVGVSVPKFIASDSPILQQVGAAAKSLPIFGTRIVNAAKKTIADFAGAKQRTAEGFGGGVAETAASAGQRARDALEEWIGPVTEGVLSNEYGAVDRLVNATTTTPLRNTRFASAAIEARNRAAGLPAGGAVRHVEEALSRPSGLTYQGIKDLRTRVGEIIKNPTLLPKDAELQQYERLYGALTKDLRAATENAGGPAARQAFDQANLLNAKVAKRREELSRILGKNVPVSAEALFERIQQKAGSRASADITMLDKLRRTMPADAWDSVASGVVNRMGASPATGEVSLNKFFTEYNQLSNAGKALLFGNQPHLGAALDDLAIIAGRHKEIATYANPSGTGQTVAAVGLGTTALSPANWPHIAVSALGAYLLTRALTRPATVRAMTGWGRVWEQINRGARMGRPVAPLQRNLQFVSRRFASEIGREFGLGADQVRRIAAGLEGNTPAVAAPGEADQKQ